MTFSFGRSASAPITLLLVATIVALFWALVSVSSRTQTQTPHTTAESQKAEYEWKLVTSWPKNFPGLGTAPEVFARSVEEMSNGRLKIKVYAGGELVPAMGVFDAVSLGSVQMGHSAAYYWKGKIPASIFFTSVPFGLTAQEQNGWLHHGGGMELWREVYAPYNVIPLAGGNSGVQSGGWFKKPINSIADLKGLKMRIPGVGGEVFRMAGGTSITLPGSEIYTSLQTGVIDATEWVGPYNDLSLAFHEVAKYYYYPGWHEPGATLEITINKDAFNSLPSDLQKIVEVAAQHANQDMLDMYTAQNPEALRALTEDHGVHLTKFPDDVLRQLRQAANEYLEALAKEDPVSAKVYKNWKAYKAGVERYHRISEQAYINTRDL